MRLTWAISQARQCRRVQSELFCSGLLAKLIIWTFHECCLSSTAMAWMLTHRDLVPNGSATAKALDYSLKRWIALTRYLEDGVTPIDNNAVEHQIRPWALGRSNWLFAGSLRSSKRAAAIMGLIQSARMNGHDPYAYLNHP